VCARKRDPKIAFVSCRGTSRRDCFRKVVTNISIF
jgi:hypothetical protein